MNRLALIISFVALTVSTARAQELATVNPDAQTAAMAGTSTAISSTSFSVYGNAAAALFDFEYINAGFSYMPLKNGGMAGRYYSVGGYYSLNEKNTIEAGTRIYKLPVSGGYHPLEASADVAYARLVHENAGVAVTAHYLHGAYGKGINYNALSFDLSTYAQFQPDKMSSISWIAVGAKIADVGFAFGNHKSRLPSRASVGAAMYMTLGESHALQGSVDFGYRFAPKGSGSFGASIGAEYTLMQLLSFRGGYHVADRHGVDYGTVGAGLSFMMLRVDFAYTIAQKSSPLRNLYVISAGINF